MPMTEAQLYEKIGRLVIQVNEITVANLMLQRRIKELEDKEGTDKVEDKVVTRKGK